MPEFCDPSRTSLKMKTRREHRQIYSGTWENKEKIESRTETKLYKKIIEI